MTTPVYNPQIPQPDNSIAEGQIDFLANFSTLANAFGSDHVGLTAASNAGNHSYARMLEEPVGVATGASEVALYSKLVEDQTDQIFYRGIGNGQEVQYSNYQIFPLAPIKNGNTVVQTPYFTFLPGGIIMYFGQIILSSVTDLVLNPAICDEIIGVQLCTVGTTLLYPSAGAPQPNQQGKYDRLRLSFTTLTATTQNYIIYGTI